MAKPTRARRLLIVQPGPCSPSETFLQAHADRLPADVMVVHGTMVNGRSLRSELLAIRAARKLVRLLRGLDWEAELTASYLKAIRIHKADAVLAEYGTTAVGAIAACRRAGLPLIAHFHGYDASIHELLQENRTAYQRLFAVAAAIIAVSRAMRAKLVDLGAPAEKVHWSPYGVDCAGFGGGDPMAAPPTFLAVGRFTAKKAPQLTLQAFAEVHRKLPDARLRMVGFGPLLAECEALAVALGIAESVTFLGSCPPSVVQEEMRRARCFVQHSVVASDGDSEGTPLAILEASATGLPVVSTRHGGIPDVVQEGQTGFLVNEHDVQGMAERMGRLAANADLAGQLGRAGRQRALAEFSIDKSIDRLWSIIESSIDQMSTTSTR